MINKNEEYIPALRYNWLTHWYDPVIAATTREKVFKKRLIMNKVGFKSVQIVEEIYTMFGTMTLYNAAKV